MGKSNSSHSKMKAVIILGALALVLVSGLELNEEESQLSLSEGTLQREARDAQPGRMRRGKKGSKKGKKGAAKRKSKGKKKKGQGRRANKKVGKGRNNRRNNKKKGKAAPQFGDAADSLDAATGGGQSCGSGKPDSDTTDALAKLKNCSKSAAALCDNSAVNDT